MAFANALILFQRIALRGRVFEAATSEKEALFIPGGGHVDLYDYPEVPTRVVDFVQRQLSDSR